MKGETVQKSGKRYDFSLSCRIIAAIAEGSANSLQIPSTQAALMQNSEQEQEIERLIYNQKSLLEAVPEMVLLVKNNESVEYMNPGAKVFFGDLCSKSTEMSSVEQEKALFLLSIVNKAVQEKKIGAPQETTYDNCHLEYTLAPFKGYQGDELYWLFIRDLTQIKKQFEELSLFHNSIETVLAHKIGELKESESVRKSLTKELNALKEHLKVLPSEGKMVGSSRALRELRNMVLQVAKSDATILITGESGTGKEMVADLTWKSSTRNDKPFLKINCNTINDSLLESDLFGHEKGAFTGADVMHKGKFEVVDGGTIFLDEIGDITPRMQAALLRVLQDGVLLRVGGNTPIKVDVRVIAATNRDLSSMVLDGSFRLDLYYRLNIISISMPPLRERKEDIIELTTHFIRKYRQAFNKDIKYLPQSILDRLLQHNWPGNIRELENVIQRAVIMAKNDVITINDLSFDMQPGKFDGTTQKGYLQRIDNCTLKELLAEVEKEVISYSLEKNHGNAARTFKQLDVCKTAFYGKLKRYGLHPKEEE